MPHPLRILSHTMALVGWLALPVAAVWLMALRQWWVLVAVAALLLAAPLFLSVALLPGLALAAGAAKIAATRRTLGRAGGFLGLLYMAALITAWCMSVFTLLIGRATPHSLLPLLLLAFAVGAGPWKYIARKALRDGRRAESVQTFFLQLVLLLVIATYLVWRPANVLAMWWLFGIVMLVEVVVYMSPSFGAKRDAAPSPLPQSP